MSRVTTAGQRHDSIGFPPVLADVRIARPWGGPPRIRPDHVLADKAYSSKEIRDYLAGRTIRATIPERADQQHHRVRRRRPAPAFDPTPTGTATSSNAASTSSTPPRRRHPLRQA